MALDTGANVLPVFDLKSASLTLVALVLKTTDVAALADELERRFGDSPALFDVDPVVVDLAPVADATDPIDFAALVGLLSARGMRPVAVKGGSAAQHEAALAAGLVEAPQTPPSRAQEASEPPAPPAVRPSVPATTLIVDKPLRSGQQVYARGGDLVVLAVVSYGAEVIADGSIHVYATLRGRAVAGARGDTQARIFSTCMEPQLVAIAGIYRTTDTALPADVQGKPAQVRLAGDTLAIEALKL